MIITAKFAGTCPCCSGVITVGSKVEWSKGAKAVHAACAGKSAGPTVAKTSSNPRRSYARSGGKWNGCSCGAREYPDGSISDNACWTCKHDAA